MSLFNPIRSQYRRLVEQMNGMHCLLLQEAAAAMRVREAKVQDSLDKMVKKKLFGNDLPYIDHGILAVVQDRRFHAFAELFCVAKRLKADLVRMRNVCIFTPEEKSQARVQMAGNFIREVVGNAFSETGAGGVLRQKGGAFLRDLMSPEASMPSQNAQNVASILIEDTDALISYLESHPDEKTDRELTLFVHSLDRQVQSFVSCYPVSGLPNSQQRMTAEEIVRRMQSEAVPKFSDFLERLYRGDMNRIPGPKTPQDELREQSRQLLTLSSQMATRHMRVSVSRLAGLLNEIADQLSVSPSKSAESCVRSLRNVYLPMTQELLMKYMRYERSIDPGPEVTKAMHQTETVLDEDLPKALKGMLKDLRSDSAIDMEAQASALRTKMRIDGMIN